MYTFGDISGDSSKLAPVKYKTCGVSLSSQNKTMVIYWAVGHIWTFTSYLASGQKDICTLAQIIKWYLDMHFDYQTQWKKQFLAMDAVL